MRFPWGSQKKRPIFLCHGCFDLLHVGHLAHLLEVKRLASRVNGLVYVSVTADEFVRKGPGRPLMPAFERVELLANLRCVDRAFVSAGETGCEAIARVKPRWYCKGADYVGLLKDDGRSIGGTAQTLWEERDIVRTYGGDILYTNTPVFHSTDYLRRYLHANSL